MATMHAAIGIWQLLILLAVAALALAFRRAVDKGIVSWLDRHGKK